MKNRPHIVPLVATFVLAVSACGGGTPAETEGTLNTTPTTTIAKGTGTAMSFIASNPELSVLAELVTTANLGATLSGNGSYTVFAPTNAAFAALGDSALATLKSDPQALAQILLTHVLASDVGTIDILEGGIEAISGATLNFTIGDTISVNGANIIGPDNRFSNGYVHVVDAVIAAE